MPKTFLNAGWRNLLMANYQTDPAILQKYLPPHTELDQFNGIHYVSLVGFLFMNTKVRGIGFPFHRTFQEVNLRFYVRYKERDQWKRGVVFVKEIVPKRLISFIANTVYGEKYVCLPMRHNWLTLDNNNISIEYYWKVKNDWNFLKAIATANAQTYAEGTEENFITEHYWGYTSLANKRTGEYQVTHPQWRIHNVLSYDISCSTGALYGKEFVETLQQPPRSVFLAEGSDINVMSGKKIMT
jgi:uncharacterized protein